MIKRLRQDRTAIIRASSGWMEAFVHELNEQTSVLCEGDVEQEKKKSFDGSALSCVTTLGAKGLSNNGGGCSAGARFRYGAFRWTAISGVWARIIGGAVGDCGSGVRLGKPATGRCSSGRESNKVLSPKSTFADTLGEHIPKENRSLAPRAA